MPHIITTHPDYSGMPSHEFADQRGSESRRAVATLEEAREATISEFRDRAEHDGFDLLAAIADMLPEAGGRVGPLPDGTVIEVRPVSWDELTRDMPDYVNDDEIDAFGDEIIDAYNARHSAA